MLQPPAPVLSQIADTSLHQFIEFTIELVDSVQVSAQFRYSLRQGFILAHVLSRRLVQGCNGDGVVDDARVFGVVSGEASHTEESRRVETVAEVTGLPCPAKLTSSVARCSCKGFHAIISLNPPSNSH